MYDCICAVMVDLSISSILLITTIRFHLQLVADCGGIPVPIPIVRGTHELLPQYQQNMHGLLMVEGDDIDPQVWDNLSS